MVRNRLEERGIRILSDESLAPPQRGLVAYAYIVPTIIRAFVALAQILSVL
jgi:hypothetical protein